jgi:carbon storage regulator
MGNLWHVAGPFSHALPAVVDQVPVEAGSQDTNASNGVCTMLVLSRKESETLLIGDDVVITIVRIDRDNVRIGIEAPPTVKVWRSEIAPKDKKEAASD